MTALDLTRNAVLLGELLNDFILAHIVHGAGGLSQCASSLLALEKLGSFDATRVEKIANT